MKKLLVLIPVLAFFLTTCSNDFEVTGPWKEIPVVYGILSPKDTAHYIRIEKAFLDPKKSALEVAQIVDSLYYPADAISVYLSRSATPQTHLPLVRVDGNLEGYVRSTGIFASSPNWLYKLKLPANQSLIPGEKYKLTIERGDDKPDITAETTIPKNFIISMPSPAQIPSPISFLDQKNTTIRWTSDENGFFFNISFVIRYHDETNGVAGPVKSLVWKPLSNIRRKDNPDPVTGNFATTADVPGTTFLAFLQENIPASDVACSGCIRRFDTFDMSIEGGGKEIESYLEAASANAGLTGAEVIPVYSNISEGYGLFTGKNVTTLTNIKITTKSVEEMQTNDLTRLLNFK